MLATARDENFDIRRNRKITNGFANTGLVLGAVFGGIIGTVFAVCDVERVMGCNQTFWVKSENVPYCPVAYEVFAIGTFSAVMTGALVGMNVGTDIGEAVAGKVAKGFARVPATEVRDFTISTVADVFTGHGYW